MLFFVYYVISVKKRVIWCCWMILNEFKSIIIKENIYLWKIRRFNGLYMYINLEIIIIFEKKNLLRLKKN